MTRIATFVGVAAVVSIAGAAQGGVTGSEMASASVGFVNPSFDTTFDADLWLDRFDTLGGTRTLTSVDLLWRTTEYFSGTYEANPSADHVGTQINWEEEWVGNVAGIAMPYTPDNLDLNRIWHGNGIGEDSEPGEPGGNLVDNFPDPVIIWENYGDTGLTDSALLAALTGVGQAHIDGMLSLSAAEEVPYGDILHDLFFPDVVFVPGFMSLQLDSFLLEVEATYHYSTVPGPGAAALFGLGAIGSMRRRRGAPSTI